MKKLVIICLLGLTALGLAACSKSRHVVKKECTINGQSVSPDNPACQYPDDNV